MQRMYEKEFNKFKGFYEILILHLLKFLHVDGTFLLKSS